MAPVTVEKVDALIKDLDAAYMQVLQVQGSTVKLPSAEINLLSILGNFRDDLLDTLKSKDRETMAEIFGGSCFRVAHVRALIDKLQLSPMNASDQRLSGCSNACLSMKEVLIDMGLGEVLEKAEEQEKEVLESFPSSKTLGAESGEGAGAASSAPPPPPPPSRLGVIWVDFKAKAYESSFLKDEASVELMGFHDDKAAPDYCPKERWMEYIMSRAEDPSSRIAVAIINKRHLQTIKEIRASCSEKGLTPPKPVVVTRAGDDWSADEAAEWDIDASSVTKDWVEAAQIALAEVKRIMQ